MDAWTWLGFVTKVSAAAEVERKAGAGSVPLDLRSPDAFAAGHIPGAVNVPVNDLLADPAAAEARVRESHPEAKAVTLYLQGGEEPALYQAAYALQGRVRLAVFLFPPGLSAWKAAGRPVHSTE
jgi:rhodanese-related sulfurtransferase